MVRSKPVSIQTEQSGDKLLATGTRNTQNGTRIRYQNEEQYNLICKAAHALNPPRSLNLFFLEAAIERANKVLGGAL